MAQRLALHPVQRRYRGNLPPPGRIHRQPAPLALPHHQPCIARGLEPLPSARHMTAPAPSTPRTASRRRPATPPSTSSRGRSPSRTSRRPGARRPRWSERRRCGLCSSSSTAPCWASRGLPQGRCQAQRSPKWLQGGPRAGDPGPRTCWGPQGLRERRDIVSSQDP